MSTAEPTPRRPVSAPPLRRQVMELLWPLEAGAFVFAAPLLRLSGRGDGHPVLVLPGFTADDASTLPLRWSIRGQGYQTHAWRLGRNVGPTEAIVTGMRSRLHELADRHERKVSIVGWSLGGVYARALARERPDLVRQVITLGSPYRMVEGDQSSVMSVWKRFEHLHDADVDLNRIAEQERPKLTVPATSVYSRRDGVAPWQTCIDETGTLAENIEVYGSHSSLGVHPAVTFAVLDRLRLPEDQWRPFRAPCTLRLWYPRPVSWRAGRGRRLGSSTSEYPSTHALCTLRNVWQRGEGSASDEPPAGSGQSEAAASPGQLHGSASDEPPAGSGQSEAAASPGQFRGAQACRAMASTSAKRASASAFSLGR